jgi:hypothetical protein
MFKSDQPRFLRALSLFHVPLPILLVWLVYRLGYDPQALLAQTIFCWVVLLICFFFTKPAENINWVFGPGLPQQRLPRGLYFALLMVFFPLCAYLPTHFVLLAIAPATTR